MEFIFILTAIVLPIVAMYKVHDLHDHIMKLETRIEQLENHNRIEKNF